MNSGRVLVLAHREELIYQAVAHAERAGLEAGVEMGPLRCHNQDVVVATVQTLVARRRCFTCRGTGCPECAGDGYFHRMERFDPMSFQAVIIDEGHHATARTYRKVISYFRRNPELKVLLVTATPQRSDGVGMWNVVDTCAYQMELKTAIQEGWLCPIRQRFVQVKDLDLSRVPTKAGGDLADGELERVFLGTSDSERERLLHEVAKPSIEQAGGRPLLIFAAGVRHATELAAACNAYDGVQAECVVGDTRKDERRQIIERYKQGVTNVLTGCGVFTEGFDAPATEVIAMARPTNSLSLYLQCIGRGTRPLPGVVDGVPTAKQRRSAIEDSGKPHCIVLDFAGNSGKHKLVSVLDALAGSSVACDDYQDAIETAKESGEVVDMEELLEKARQAREQRELLAQQTRQERLSTQQRADRCSYQAEDVDLFAGDSFDPMANFKARPGGATERQVRYLIRLGVSPETAKAVSKNQARGMIDRLRGETGGDFRITGGKYQGRRLSEVPHSYQEWLLKEDAFGAAEHVRKMRRPEPPASIESTQPLMAR